MRVFIDHDQRSRMKKTVLILFAVCTSLLYADEIKIAVAANVSYAMEDLKKAFNVQHPETKVQVTLGSSGKLTAQISHGAPYQLFMAANMKYPEVLYKNGTAETKPVIYAKGGLAYLSAKKKPFGKGMALITDKSVQKIVIANPKTAPYGKAAMEVMENAGVLKEASSKLIYAETVSQTVSYTLTAADLGFIAKSSLYSPNMKHFKEGIHWADVDTKLYTPIDQGIVILKNGAGNAEVKAFYDFMLSSEAKKILTAYGYLVP